MGKGFNNYMCKKFFHPASRDNLKRVWMAEQKTEANKKKQEELRLQYEKEQDLYNNKALLSKESKDKLSVNFLYEPPPGMKREREKETGATGEPEFKFEWQRKYNAPREDYCKGDEEIRDQPFGIQVRNVRCIRCHKWGHINTDRECSMRGQANDVDGLEMDPLMLMHKMREEGLAIKHSALGVRQNAPGQNQELLDDSDEDGNKLKLKLGESDDEEEDGANPEQAFLSKLSTKQKKKLLRKLEKITKEKRKEKKKLSSSRHKSKKSKKSKTKKSSSDSSSSESDSDKKKKSKKSKRKSSNKSSSSDSDSGKEKEKRRKSKSSSSGKIEVSVWQKPSTSTEMRKSDEMMKQGGRRIEDRLREMAGQPAAAGVRYSNPEKARDLEFPQKEYRRHADRDPEHKRRHSPPPPSQERQRRDSRESRHSHSTTDRARDSREFKRHVSNDRDRRHDGKSKSPSRADMPPKKRYIEKERSPEERRRRESERSRSPEGRQRERDNRQERPKRRRKSRSRSRSSSEERHKKSRNPIRTR